MKHVPIILLGALLLACGEQKKQREAEWSSVEVEEPRNTDLTQDTVKAAASAPKEDLEPVKEPVPSSSKSVRSSPKKYNDDNLRGWDPASEDDMDDNGMSRYMENYDEEGWD